MKKLMVVMIAMSTVGSPVPIRAQAEEYHPYEETSETVSLEEDAALEYQGEADILESVPESKEQAEPISDGMEEYYRINLSIDNASAEIMVDGFPNSRAKTGSSVSIKVVLEKGCHINISTLSVTDSSGHMIPIKLLNEDTLLFTMPETDVYIYGAATRETYGVHITRLTGNGWISFAQDGKAIERGACGVPVKIIPEASLKSQFDTVSVKTADGESVEVNDLQFVMPQEDVYVEARFTDYRITTNFSPAYGAVEIYVNGKEGNRANYNDEIKLVLIPDDHYCFNGNLDLGCWLCDPEVTWDGLTGTFSMPHSNIVVNPNFEKREPGFIAARDLEHAKTILYVNGQETDRAYKGDRVDIKVYPDSGYFLDGIILDPGTENERDLTFFGNQGSFICENLEGHTYTVRLRYNGHDIAKAPVEHGTMALFSDGMETDNELPGTKVIVKCRPEDGYCIKDDSVHVVAGENGTEVPVIRVSERNFEFVMPEENVTVSARYHVEYLRDYRIDSYPLEFGRLVITANDEEAVYACPETVIRVRCLPKEGYGVSSICVLRHNGALVPVICVGPNEYEFEMPEDDVRVLAELTPEFLAG